VKKKAKQTNDLYSAEINT